MVTFEDIMALSLKRINFQTRGFNFALRVNNAERSPRRAAAVRSTMDFLTTFGERVFLRYFLRQTLIVFCIGVIFKDLKLIVVNEQYNCFIEWILFSPSSRGSSMVLGPPMSTHHVLD